MSISTLIIDDEFLARERLKKLLEPHEDFYVLGECKNGIDALKIIKQKKPDLLFLDIHMPGSSGLDLIQKLEQHKIEIPLTVFTTAHDNYAIDAFQSNAIDYLLKPFEKDRFDQTIARVKNQMKLIDSLGLSQRMLSLIKTYAPNESRFRSKFELKEKGIDVHININEVIFLEADSNYLKLHTFDKTWLYRSTMNQICEELNPKDFIRIHRSLVINMRFLVGYKYINNNEFVFKMKNGGELTSGRSHFNTIQQHFAIDR